MSFRFLKPLKLSKGEFLLSIGNAINEIYFVNKGSLRINPGSVCGYMEIAEIKKKNNFEDIYLQMNDPSPFEIKCKSKIAEVFKGRLCNHNEQI
jgi:hypothetical protein